MQPFSVEDVKELVAIVKHIHRIFFEEVNLI
jgi:hypothetical protein